MNNRFPICMQRITYFYLVWSRNIVNNFNFCTNPFFEKNSGGRKPLFIKRNVVFWVHAHFFLCIRNVIESSLQRNLNAFLRMIFSFCT